MSLLTVKKPKKFRSLTVTLAFAFLALSTVVLLISSSLNIYFGFQNQRKVIDVQQQFVAQKAAYSVKEFINDKFNILVSSIDFTNMHRVSLEDQKLGLEKLLGMESAFRQLILFDAQQLELLNISRLSKMVSGQLTDQIKHELFSQIKQDKRYISSINIDQITYEPLLVMAVPVTNVFGDVNGVVAAELNLKFMWDLMDQIEIGRNGYAYVVDMQGYLIAFHDVSRVLKRENLGYLEEVNEFIKGNESVHESKAEIAKGILRTNVLTTHVHLGQPKWAVVVELPILEAYETVVMTFVLSVLVMVLSFTLAIVAGVFLSRRMTKPIIELRDATEKIGKGQLTTKINIKSKNEIGELAASFNKMVDDLDNTTVSRDSLIKEVTERKRTEETLRISEEKYRKLFEEAQDGIVLADAETGVIVDCNHAAAELVGRKKSELIGKPQTILHPTEEVEEEFSRTFKQHLKDKEGLVLETQVITKKREIKDVAIKANLIELKGNIIIQGLFRDITEHRRAEENQARLLAELESANQELKDFAYIVSHDLKAPLRAIGSLAEWIMADHAEKLGDEGKEQLNLLSNRVRRMHNLIEGILQYSRVGRISEEKENVDLNLLVGQIIDSIAPPENIKIKIRDNLPSIMCEKTRMGQVFQNLISNAIKYMDKPQGKIEIGCAPENGYWEFSVSDNGPGIEKQYFDKIFQIFQTLKPRDEYESTGIGLTVVKKIIETNGGSIWVDSVVGKGSTFYFTVPHSQNA